MRREGYQSCTLAIEIRTEWEMIISTGNNQLMLKAMFTTGNFPLLREMHKLRTHHHFNCFLDLVQILFLGCICIFMGNGISSLWPSFLLLLFQAPWTHLKCNFLPSPFDSLPWKQKWSWLEKQVPFVPKELVPIDRITDFWFLNKTGVQDRASSRSRTGQKLLY